MSFEDDREEAMDSFNDMSPAELEELLHVEPEFDPEHQIEMLREEVESLAYDADVLDDGATFEVVEKALLHPDPLWEEDTVWWFEYDGDEGFAVRDPEGTVRGEVEGEDAFDQFGEIASEYHREEQIRRFKARVKAGRADEGEMCLLPNGKLELTEDGMVAVFDPQRELAEVAHIDDPLDEIVVGVIDDWKQQMRAKYAGTPMEEHWD
ncbi:hypothetical protein HUG10_21145 (plasmid) [Halorarum halophilum]|uniref:Uncharacterized protein n=1 Tax=Halorarum halophilum TaxID=2743090 RepID=A0A7D5KPB2_9EURY|nr:hypothetical protein [Halobaculum halophilum]QLG30095.1 hypothetical protein HUG10_21145 [Halobaculum halophilum]